MPRRETEREGVAERAKGGEGQRMGWMETERERQRSVISSGKEEGTL